MKNTTVSLWTSCLILTLLLSCKKYTTPADQGNDSTLSDFTQVFDKFWNGVNSNYVYWDTDTTDWDAIYHKYRPLFEQLDLHNETDVSTSVSYFTKMTYSLKDAHFQIIFSTPPIAGINIYPAAQRKQGAPGFHFPYDYSNVDVHYFDSGYSSVFDSLTDPKTTPLHVMLATIGNNILYFSCNEFSLLHSCQSQGGTGVRATLASLFTSLRDGSNQIKGIIIDVRNNFGGDLSDLDFLVGHFIGSPLFFGYSRYKSGTGRLDYTPWIEARITPQSGSVAVKVPVIALTDNYTVSLSEAVAMAIHALPNGMVVGETTWGATGPLVANEVYNDGQFILPGFSTVYTSSAEFKYIDNKMYEGIGFPPDIFIPFNAQALQGGRDPQLEAAITNLR